jgi:hypothetical protein
MNKFNKLILMIYYFELLEMIDKLLSFFYLFELFFFKN